MKVKKFVGFSRVYTSVCTCVADGHTQCCHSVTTTMYACICTCTCAAHRNSGLVGLLTALRMEGEVLGGMQGLQGRRGSSGGSCDVVS